MSIANRREQFWVCCSLLSDESRRHIWDGLWMIVVGDFGRMYMRRFMMGYLQSEKKKNCRYCSISCRKGIRCCGGESRGGKGGWLGRWNVDFGRCRGRFRMSFLYHEMKMRRKNTLIFPVVVISVFSCETPAFEFDRYNKGGNGGSTALATAVPAHPRITSSAPTLSLTLKLNSLATASL